MVDLGRQQGFDVPSLSVTASSERRLRLWYDFWLTLFLIGPAVAALAVMGWLRAP